MVNASFCEIGETTVVGSDAIEKFSNFTPLDWPRKASARLKFG